MYRIGRDTPGKSILKTLTCGRGWKNRRNCEQMPFPLSHVMSEHFCVFPAIGSIRMCTYAGLVSVFLALARKKVSIPRQVMPDTRCFSILHRWLPSRPHLQHNSTSCASNPTPSPCSDGVLAEERKTDQVSSLSGSCSRKTTWGGTIGE